MFEHGECDNLFMCYHFMRNLVLFFPFNFDYFGCIMDLKLFWGVIKHLITSLF